MGNVTNIYNFLDNRVSEVQIGDAKSLLKLLENAEP